VAHSSALPNVSRVVRVLVVNNSRMNGEILTTALKRDERLQVLNAVSDVRVVGTAVAEEKPSVVLVSIDIDGNRCKGLEVVREINGRHSEARVVMLLDSSERSQVVEAFRAGAHGVFSRGESLKSLVKCIFCISQGQVWASSRELCFLLEALGKALPPRLTDAGGEKLLSRREQEVVQGVVDGLSNRVIAQRLGLTEHTIKNYLFRIFDKLGVSKRIELVRYAYCLGNVDDVLLPVNASGQKAPALIAAQVV
jgi:two-component system nitrate/nitrite response regulator NarL